MRIEKLKPFGVCLHFDNTRTLEQIKKTEIEALLQEHKLILIRGVAKPERDDLLSFCESFPKSKTLNWSFGPVMEMKESEDPQNYLFSREAVPFHWDGAFHFVPDYLVFSCVQAPTNGAGGETLFANTELIFQSAPEERKTLWAQVDLKYETAKLAHYGGSICGPLLQTHPRNGKNILRFAEPVNTKLNPVTLDVIAKAELNADDLVKDLTERIYAAEFCYRHEWQEGDLLLADNHSLVHGRTAFEKNCPRHLRRIQLIKE
ncbi:TauD/TfdA dioxygenase family protein [Bdellovibrio sp. BCCA]|uniref:TauD/TfdA dioxygenase family protein n=1 Tax=Bdellovibrio sp. BCCA TaxID=3136281 RepID=UPI0030F1B72D